MAEHIKCPHCGKDIEVTEVLTHQIRASMQAEVEGKLAEREQEFAKQQAALKQREKEVLAAKEGLDEQVNEKLRAERASMAQQKRVLDEQQSRIAEQVAAQVKAEKQRIADEALKKAKEEVAGATKAMADELAEKNAKIAEANRKELEFLRQKREFEEQKTNMQLEIARKLDADRKEIEQKARQKALDEQVLRTREKDDKIEALTRQINELQRKAEQGSQEAQGETLEGALQESLMQSFPFDLFMEVKKGQRGADIIQIVRNITGKECGKIVWEAKFTKSYTNAWIDKLKSDQQAEAADIAVLTTITLPKDIKNFGLLDGVWVTDYASVMGLATALRIGLINATKEKTLSANQDTMKDVIYRYVTGQEFAMQIRAVADAFGRMKEELDREKRAMEKIWKSREKQIETVLTNVSGIQGSLQGYLGQKMLTDTGVAELEGISEGAG
jgi:hypothetical protein